MNGLTLNLEPLVTEQVNKVLKEMGLDKKIDEALGVAVQKASKHITVTNSRTTEKMGVQHKQFETILKLVNIGENLMIKGEAGNGKSYTVEQVAKALNLPFHSMSVSNQTTKTDLLGFVDANGVYRYNGFISAFKDGGIFNMDEIDAGNANVLVVMNSALSNGFIECPNGEMIYAHKDFRFTATANTVGRGATSKYVGRNKLDSATMDRFAVLNYELDEDIELMMCGSDKLFHKAIKAMRVEADKNYEDFMISQRSSSRLYNLIQNDFSITDGLEIAVFKGCDEDIVKTLTKKFCKIYTMPTESNTEVPTEPKEVVEDEVVEEAEQDAMGQPKESDEMDW